MSNKPIEEKKIYPNVPYPKWMVNDIGVEDEVNAWKYDDFNFEYINLILDD